LADEQGWASRNQATAVNSQTSVFDAGCYSLEVTISASAGTGEAYTSSNISSITGSSVLTFRVRGVNGGQVSSIVAYVKYQEGGAQEKTSAGSAPDGNFNTFTVDMSGSSPSSIDEIGVRFTVSAGSGESAYVDAVNW